MIPRKALNIAYSCHGWAESMPGRFAGPLLNELTRVHQALEQLFGLVSGHNARGSSNSQAAAGCQCSPAGSATRGGKKSNVNKSGVAAG